MLGAIAAQPVAVIRYNGGCDAPVARAALKNRWGVVEGESTNLVRNLLAGKTRVMVVQLGEGPGQGLDAVFSLISRLSRHWNPVRAVVVGPASGADYESAARRAGAAAYVPAGSETEVIENIAGQLLESGVQAPAGTALVSDMPSEALPRTISHGAQLRRA